MTTLRRFLFAPCLLLPCLAHGGTVDVRVSGRDVDVRAEGAYLDDVLEKVAAATGMELDWPAPRPRPLVSVNVAGKRAAEAIPAILEGLRFNYAMKLGPDGSVAMLVMLDGLPPERGTPSLEPGRFPGMPAEKRKKLEPAFASPPAEDPAAE